MTVKTRVLRVWKFLQLKKNSTLCPILNPPIRKMTEKYSI